MNRYGWGILLTMAVLSSWRDYEVRKERDAHIEEADELNGELQACLKSPPYIDVGLYMQVEDSGRQCLCPVEPLCWGGGEDVSPPEAKCCGTETEL